MSDVFTRKERSRIMRAVRSKNTRPEVAVRRLVRRLGHRCRLHVKLLPGTPDIVFPSRRKAIFVHGCYWHRHACEAGRSMPSSRVDYWRTKFDRNKRRDLKSRQALRRLGWSTLVVWECQLKDAEKLESRISKFLNNRSLRRHAATKRACRR